MYRFTIAAGHLALLAASLACAAERTTGTGPETVMEITVVASGVDRDTHFGVNVDGYFLEADLDQSAGAGDSVRLRMRLVPGTYVVELTHVAAQCTVTEGNPRTVTVNPGQLASVRFTVTCGASTGVVTVTAVTTGPDPDPDGYIVGVQGHPSLKRLDANGDTVSFAGLGGGSRSVFLFQAAPNCTPHPDNPQRVTVSTGGAGRDTVRVTLRVTCEALGRVQATVTSTGVDLDADGYVVSVVPGPPGQSAAVAANGVTFIPVDRVGGFTAVLGDVSPNCMPTAPVAVPVLVASGDTTAVTFSVSCAPASRIAFVRNGGIQSARTNGDSLHQVTWPGDAPAWSPDGTRLAFISVRLGVLGVFVMNADGSDVTRLRSIRESGQRPAWSPDGTRLAFVDDSDGNGTSEIHVMNADGTGAARIIASASSERSPAWSPDGTRIAFSSLRDGAGSIYVANADGTGVTRLTTGPQDDRPAWSPDGTRIAFDRSAGSANQPMRALMIVNASGGGPTILAEENVYTEAAWSPDGAWIAFSVVLCDSYYGYCYGEPSIRVIRPDGSDERPLVKAPAAYPAWKP